jgi:PIN like domain
MNILLDECTPRIVKKRLSDFAIRTVQEMGWAGIKNGALLKLAEAQFEVFITTDKNLRHQQNLAKRKLAFILLPTNQVPIVATLIPEIEAALNKIQIGDFVEIPFP